MRSPLNRTTVSYFSSTLLQALIVVSPMFASVRLNIILIPFFLKFWGAAFAQYLSYFQ